MILKNQIAGGSGGGSESNSEERGSGKERTVDREKSICKRCVSFLSSPVLLVLGLSNPFSTLAPLQSPLSHLSLSPTFVDVGGLGQAPWDPTERGASRKRQWWEPTQIFWAEQGYFSATALVILLGATIMTEIDLNRHLQASYYDEKESVLKFIALL